MIYDCHLHTDFSGDSHTPIRSQIERAILLGMEELCITDHHDYDSGFCEDHFELNLPSYLDALRRIREAYRGKIRINLGIELGLQCHLREYLTQFDRLYGNEFDFIIGSSHFVDRTDPYDPPYWEKAGVRRGMERFFEVSLARVRRLCDVFDSYGHLDYVVRYAPGHAPAYSDPVCRDWIDSILRELIAHQKALECNSGGYKYGLGQPNPCRDILQRYRELGGELITIGSDAHVPEYVGYAFQECRQLLQSCGFQYYTVFHNRRAEMIRL